MASRPRVFVSSAPPIESREMRITANLGPPRVSRTVEVEVGCDVELW
jgi:hypothetical protein